MAGCRPAIRGPLEVEFQCKLNLAWRYDRRLRVRRLPGFSARYTDGAEHSPAIWTLGCRVEVIDEVESLYTELHIQRFCDFSVFGKGDVGSDRAGAWDAVPLYVPQISGSLRFVARRVEPLNERWGLLVNDVAGMAAGRITVIGAGVPLRCQLWGIRNRCTKIVNVQWQSGVNP